MQSPGFFFPRYEGTLNEVFVFCNLCKNTGLIELYSCSFVAAFFLGGGVFLFPDKSGEPLVNIV